MACIYIPPPYPINFMQVLPFLWTWWRRRLRHHVRPKKTLHVFQRIMHTLHKGMYANFSQLVIRICGRDLSPPCEYSTLPIRSRRTFGSWDCVFVCTFENICIKSMYWREYTQAHHLLTEQAFHMIEIFSYTRIFPLFLICPATYQPVFLLDSFESNSSLFRVWILVKLAGYEKQVTRLSIEGAHHPTYNSSSLVDLRGERIELPLRQSESRLIQSDPSL